MALQPQQIAVNALSEINNNETMTKDQQISALILIQIANGKDVEDALDSVLGTGTFDVIVDSLYNR